MSKNELLSIQKELRSLENRQKAKSLSRYFKTGKGDYAEGDVFLGLNLPQLRSISKKYSDLSLSEIALLLKSKIHEERLVSLLILVNLYEKNIHHRKKIFDFYLNNLEYINNWDLVDLSSYKIVGRFLYGWNKEYFSILKSLAKSRNIWERRISIVSTYYFIKNNEFNEALKISKMLLRDEHDLIHKAVGWMLREIGKRNQNVLENFLKKHYKQMPRTMLRYSIEKFSENKRKSYLKGEI